MKKEKPQPIIKKGTDYIFHKTHFSIGGGESSKVEIVINVKDGTTRVCVEKSVRQYFDLKDYDKAVDLYERLNCGSGRRVYLPEDLAHPYNPKS